MGSYSRRRFSWFCNKWSNRCWLTDDIRKKGFRKINTLADKINNALSPRYSFAGVGAININSVVGDSIDIKKSNIFNVEIKDVGKGISDAIEGGSSVKIDSYKNMVKNPTVTGQAHHLSQNATFRDVIPKQEGLSIEFNGNALTEIGSQHYNAHNSLEGFWNNYRKGGNLYDEMPNVGEYNRALYNSLENAGISKSDSSYSVLEAFKQQRGFGLSNTDLVPRIPGRINQIK